CSISPTGPLRPRFEGSSTHTLELFGFHSLICAFLLRRRDIVPRELWYLSNSSGPQASRDLLVLTAFVTWVSQGDHGMNRCLRSLSCLFTLAGLTLFSTDATARASHKPHAQKAHEATKKSHVKEARPHRSAASGKNRHAKHASAQRKPKPSEASP